MKMRPLFVGVAMAACLLAAPSDAQTGSPITRSQAGQVECYTPDSAARTCRAMSTYRFLAGDRIVNDAIVFLQPNVVMYVSSDVTLRENQVCGEVTNADLAGARFEIAGVAATPQQANAIREAVADLFVGIGEVCSRYTQDGDVVTITVFIDGVEHPDFADRMIWIGPDDGYSIGAPPSASET
jgi:hypothetical protein